MKTHNQNPVWHNEPLRLTPPQTQNPTLVLTDFFECYHLNEVREIMWQWLTDAVSSPNSHSSDHHERNNYMFFYEKMEALVEATWIMNRRESQVFNPAREANVKTENKPVQVNDKAAQPDQFSKPARLIESATSHPDEVISKVFDEVTLKD